MSYYNGPKMITEGLALHLDAANIKSFRGEPTTNLLSQYVNPTFENGTKTSDGWAFDAKTDGTYDYYSLDKFGGNFCVRLQNSTISDIAFWRQDIPVTSGLKYTVSVYAKNISCPVTPYFSAVNMNEQAELFTGIDSSWKRFSKTFTATSTGNAQFYIRTGANASQGYFLIDDFQIEQKDYATPFVNGTRGQSVDTGGGWVDLAGIQNATLGTANRFESTYGGAITGNGTSSSNISVVNSKYYSLGTNNFTYMCWATVATVSTRVFYEGRGASLVGTLWLINYGAANSMGLFLTDKPYSAQKTYYQPTPYPSSVANTPHHYALVVDRVAGLARYYIDGVSYGTSNITATSGSITPDSGYNCGIMYDLGGAHFTGSISMFSIYPDRALSHSDIIQNFEATRRRFV